jgi:hypothetical protein
MKLAELQKRMAAAVMRPLTSSDRLAPRTDVAYIKPNDRLTSAERLEIYSKSYWYRLIDGMFEDFPGLLAVLGMQRFNRLIRAYLADCPSQSYTMRDLGSRLEQWLRKNSEYAGNKIDVALDMVALEWAHIEAWDGASESVLGPEDLLELGPKLKIGLQPYIRLLELHYPVDELRIQANAAAEEHEVASNAVTKHKQRKITHAAGRLKPENIFLAVHRVDLSVYYRRLSVEEFRLLTALREGQPIGKALLAVCKGSTIPVDELQPRLESWFGTWAELGWFCRPRRRKAAT